MPRGHDSQYHIHAESGEHATPPHDAAELRRVNIIGVPITATNLTACVDYLTENIESIRGEYVCVSNVHTTVMARDNPAYMEIQTNSLMSVPDGKPLSVLGRRKASKMARVTGPDLMREILSTTRGDGRKFRHYIYGSTPEVLEALTQKICHSFPKADIAATEPSVFRSLSPAEINQLADRINSSGSDFVWLGLGAPRQEILAAGLHGKTQSLSIAVGGAFNILAGIIPEAPRWMKELSLEWLFRLMREPRRLFRRYLTTNTRFILYVFLGSLLRQKDKL